MLTFKDKACYAAMHPLHNEWPKCVVGLMFPLIDLRLHARHNLLVTLQTEWQAFFGAWFVCQF